MPQYVFYGQFSDIGGLGRYVGKKFGQQLEIPQDVAERAVTEGAAILPIAEADKIGFDPKDLATYYAVPLHTSAPPEFIGKRQAAWQSIHDWRESLLAAKPAAVETEPVAESEPKEEVVETTEVK